MAEALAKSSKGLVADRNADGGRKKTNLRVSRGGGSASEEGGEGGEDEEEKEEEEDTGKEEKSGDDSPIRMTIGGKRMEFADRKELQDYYDKMAERANGADSLKEALSAAILKGDKKAMRRIYLAAGATDEQIEAALDKAERNAYFGAKKSKGARGDDEDNEDENGSALGRRRASVQDDEDDDDDDDAVVARIAKKKKVEDDEDIDSAPLTVGDMRVLMKELKKATGAGRKLSLADFDEESQKRLASALRGGELAFNTVKEANEARVLSVLKSDKMIARMWERMSPKQRDILIGTARNAASRRMAAGPLAAEDLEGVRQAGRAFAKDAWPELYEGRAGRRGTMTDGGGARDDNDIELDPDLLELDTKKYVDFRPGNDDEVNKMLRAAEAQIEAEQREDSSRFSTSRRNSR